MCEVSRNLLRKILRDLEVFIWNPDQARCKSGVKLCLANVGLQSQLRQLKNHKKKCGGCLQYFRLESQIVFTKMLCWQFTKCDNQMSFFG